MSWSHVSLSISDPIELLSQACLNFPWFGIRTKSNQEKVAATALSRKGYQPYLPSYIVRRRRPERMITTERPLFPGYLFCRFDPTKRLPIITTTGIVSVLGIGNEPAPIPDHEMDAIEAVRNFGVGVRPCDFIQEGQRVRVTYGSLKGFEGFLVRAKNEYRLVISVTMLHRSISVEIDRDCIAIA